MIGERNRCSEEVVTQAGGTKMRGVLALSVGAAFFPQDGTEPEAVAGRSGPAHVQDQAGAQDPAQDPIPILKQPAVAGVHLLQ